MEDSTIEAPKNFRRCHDVTLRNVDFVNAEETLWACSGVTLDNVSAHGDYLAMNCADVKADNLRLVGNYPFDGARNVEFPIPSDFEGLFLELRERDGARFVHFRRVSGVELA